MKKLSPISVTLPHRNIYELDCLCNGIGFFIMEKEVWRDVKGYDGFYQVSNLGRVKSLSRVVVRNKRGSIVTKERVLKNRINSGGYLNVTLCMHGKDKGCKVHQLVAVAFLNHTPCGHKVVVDHINNDKLDNRVTNLQLISNRENASKDRYRHNYTSKYIGVSWSKSNKKWVSYIYVNNKTINLGYFIDELEAHQAYLDAIEKHMISEAII